MADQPQGGVAFRHIPHPHIALRKPPPKVEDGHVGINGLVALWVTRIVGGMYCAYLFTVIALVALPSAIQQGSPTVLVNWLSSNFLQLVLLPIIIVGQNLQAKAADARADATYRDAEAVLHEAQEIQRHLEAQDAVLTALVAKLGGDPPA